MIRLVFALRRQSLLTLAEFQDYWLNQHAPLGCQLRHRPKHSSLCANSYDRLPNESGRPNGRVAKMEPHYDGIAELWWSSEAELVERMSSVSGKAAKAGAALLEDESKFINLPNSPLWFAYEYPQSNPAPENVAQS